MRSICTAAVLTCALSLLPWFAFGQDSSDSLGDAARQARQQKQKKTSQANKDTHSKKAAKLFTNDEIPSRFTPVNKVARTSDDAGVDAPEPQEEEKASANDWRSRIEDQKSVISSLQSQVDQLSESIHFAPANCVSNCVQWNERQQEKQQQVDQMKSQLDEEKKRLDSMQEQARKLGFGSSVYDP